MRLVLSLGRCPPLAAVLSVLPVLTVLVAVPAARAQTGWVPQISPSAANWNAVHCPDVSRAWVVGSGGAIAATTDGGLVWSSQSSGTGYDLLGVSTIDVAGAPLGVAVGQWGTILRSTDGGADWEVVRTDWVDVLRDVQMVTSAIGYAVGTNGIFQPFVAKTTDGGVNWDFSAFYIQSNEGDLHGLAMADAMTGIAAATLWDGRGAVVRTTNGGGSWTPAIIVGFPLLDVAISGSDAIAVGANGQALRSTTAGASWVASPTGIGSDLHAVCAAGGDTFFAVGASAILRTDSAGVAWTAQEFGAPVDFSGVGFADPSTGSAVGGASALLRTVTGGEVGASVLPVPGETGVAVAFPNPFTESTRLRLAAGPGDASIEIFDLAGRRVRVLDPTLRDGFLEAIWDGTDAAGRAVPGGVYFVHPPSGESSSLTRIVPR